MANGPVSGLCSLGLMENQPQFDIDIDIDWLVNIHEVKIGCQSDNPARNLSFIFDKHLSIAIRSLHCLNPAIITLMLFAVLSLP